MSESPRIVIIGGGPTGIGAAVRLQELGYENWVLYESGEDCGGLASSVVDDEGFTWDIGGHVLFSHYKYYDDILTQLGPKEFESLKRKSVLLMDKGSYVVDYPVQNHVHQMPERYHQVCLDGLEAAYRAKTDLSPTTASLSSSPLMVTPAEETPMLSPESATSEKEMVEASVLEGATTASSEIEVKPRNFTEWGMKVFGPGLVDVFLRPYNEKLWAWPLETMACDWLGERVAVPDFLEVKRRYETKSADLAWGPNRTFLYPTHGGTGAIWKTVASRLNQQKAHCNAKVVQIDPYLRTVTLASGATDAYDYVINTVQLPVLARQLISRSYSKKVLLQSLTNQLRYCSVKVTGLGVEGPRPALLDQFQWSYFPDNDAPFFRCSVMTNYSKFMAPKPTEQYSLLFESSSSQWRPEAELTTEILVDQIVQAAKDYGLVEETGKIVSKWHQVWKYGYPTPCVDRENVLPAIHEILENELRILSRGRFGGWRYEVANMDHSLMQGVEAVDRILSKETKWMEPTAFTEEPTYNKPDFVNEPVNRSALGFDQATKFN